MLEKIIQRMAGGESIHRICQDEDMPAETVFYRTMAMNEDFGRAIAKAREIQQEFEADNCVTMADNATVEDHQVVRLRIWARQWRAAKLAPKKYGEKIEQNVTHSGEVTTRVCNMTEKEIIERYEQQKRSKQHGEHCGPDGDEAGGSPGAGG